MDQYKYKEVAEAAVSRSSRGRRKRPVHYCLIILAVSLVCFFFAFVLLTMRFNIDHLTATVKEQAGELSKVERRLAAYEVYTLRNQSSIGHFAATLRDHAEKLSKMEDVQRNQSTRLSALGDRVAAIGRDNETLIRNYREYLLDLKKNLTEMHKDYAAKLSSVKKEDSALRDKHFAEMHKDYTAKLNDAKREDSLLRNKLESLQRQIGAVNENLEHSNRAMEMSRPVKVFSECKVDHSSCNIGSRGNGRFWKACRTELLPEEEVGYFTFDTSCLSDSSDERYSETQTLYRVGGKVRCECDVTYPGEDSPTQRPVEDVSGAKCVLYIRRCPNSMTLSPSR